MLPLRLKISLRFNRSEGINDHSMGYKAKYERCGFFPIVHIYIQGYAGW